MNAPDLFGVIVRTTGFLIIVRSLWSLLTGLVTALTTTLPTLEGTREYWPVPLFLMQLLALAFGLVCFLAANQIVALAYRRRLSPAL